MLMILFWTGIGRESHTVACCVVSTTAAVSGMAAAEGSLKSLCSRIPLERIRVYGIRNALGSESAALFKKINGSSKTKDSAPTCKD